MNKKDTTVRFNLTDDDLRIIEICHTNIEMPIGNYMISEDCHACSANTEELLTVILQTSYITTKLTNKLYEILLKDLANK